jgi:hypothetical protein
MLYWLNNQSLMDDLELLLTDLEKRRRGCIEQMTKFVSKVDADCYLTEYFGRFDLRRCCPSEPL